MPAEDALVAAGTPAKLTLFCPSCEHRGPATTAWRYERVPDEAVTWDFVVTCPECEATVGRF